MYADTYASEGGSCDSSNRASKSMAINVALNTAAVHLQSSSLPLLVPLRFRETCTRKAAILTVSPPSLLSSLLSNRYFPYPPSLAIMAAKYTGGCEHVKASSSAEPIDNHTCHCSVCKRVTGQPTTHVAFFNHGDLAVRRAFFELKYSMLPLCKFTYQQCLLLVCAPPVLWSRRPTRPSNTSCRKFLLNPISNYVSP